ncbi:zinc finger protein 358-like [Sitophilus oryzae]|uniref:Zinc finger protein 358-like n=1 Tax=Sitophilus oryzae TaxID=7048 RepID=A0A6J2Y871_SITOR|nr:zinc finger protein 358-like [Sitophilus oryzae]
MKTYSRKKFGEITEDVIDLDDICRLCMGKEEELFSIFNNEESVPLTLRIMACVSLEVFEGDGLPDKICHPCKFQLEKSYHFRKKCEQSDMKLRSHLRDIKEKIGDIDQQESSMENTSDVEMIEESTENTTVNNDSIIQEDTEVDPSTEEDIVGVTKVAYIQQPDPESEDLPSNITLPPEADSENKEACTLKPTKDMKTEPEEEEEAENGSYFIIEENYADMENTNMDAIADAVKATLASQPGLNLTGQLQLKVNPSEGKTTQVEVTTEDGDIIVMEIMTEEQNTQFQKVQEHNEDGELKVFQCPDCPKSFSRRIQLRRHASVHMQQKGFSCGICEKWFPTRSALVRHERIHTGERPFQCEVCSRSFAQKEILFRHLMTHTGQRPYSCPHCSKGFNQKEQLRVHLTTHSDVDGSDISLHYCTLCPKVFCHASGLSRHLLTHTGKTFRCLECDKNFTDKSSLKRHSQQAGHQITTKN